MNNSIHSEKCGYIPGINLCCHVIKNIEDKIKNFPNIFDKINNINDTELIHYIGNKNNIKDFLLYFTLKYDSNPEKYNNYRTYMLRLSILLKKCDPEFIKTPVYKLTSNFIFV